MADFNIAAYGENLRTEQSVPIDTMLKAHTIIMTQFSIKWLHRQTLSLHYENVYAWSKLINSKVKLVGQNMKPCPCRQTWPKYKHVHKNTWAYLKVKFLANRWSFELLKPSFLKNFNCILYFQDHRTQLWYYLMNIIQFYTNLATQ